MSGSFMITNLNRHLNAHLCLRESTDGPGSRRQLSSEIVLGTASSEEDKVWSEQDTSALAPLSLLMATELLAAPLAEPSPFFRLRSIWRKIVATFTGYSGIVLNVHDSLFCRILC